MDLRADSIVLFQFILLVNIQTSIECPDRLVADEKAAYKAGEAEWQSQTPITIEKIKTKLKESGVFDASDSTLSDVEKKELSKLFDAVEIMMLSRARQPQNVQNIFTSIRIVERVVKKQLKEGQISDSLASKFKWDKLSYRHNMEEYGDHIRTRRSARQPNYHLNKEII